MHFEDKEAMLEKISIIIRQTDYNELTAREKLSEYNGDHIRVIKSFMGITEKKAPPVKSINQEIYRQLRYKMNDSIRDYNQKQSEKILHELKNADE
jgi:hypothetical protein